MWYMEEIQAENGIRNLILFSAQISSIYHMGFESILHYPSVEYGICSGIQNLQWNMEFALFHIPLQRSGIWNLLSSIFHCRGVEYRKIHTTL